MDQPRRFGLTERQFVGMLSIVALAALVPLGMWAHSSTTGLVVLWAVAIVVVTAIVIHRLRHGYWFDNPPN